mmetsp:Transcript_12590/g.39716  ORF Transcript_12590/g.39716 Transcript_12590/m.39716 type:complete len:468 (-) Transcript_12590:516-1919(-)
MRFSTPVHTQACARSLPRPRRWACSLRLAAGTGLLLPRSWAAASESRFPWRSAMRSPASTMDWSSSSPRPIRWSGCSGRAAPSPSSAGTRGGGPPGRGTAGASPGAGVGAGVGGRLGGPSIPLPLASASSSILRFLASTARLMSPVALSRSSVTAAARCNGSAPTAPARSAAAILSASMLRIPSRSCSARSAWASSSRLTPPTPRLALSTAPRPTSFKASPSARRSSSAAAIASSAWIAFSFASASWNMGAMDAPLEPKRFSHTDSIAPWSASLRAASWVCASASALPREERERSAAWSMRSIRTLSSLLSFRDFSSWLMSASVTLLWSLSSMSRNFFVSSTSPRAFCSARSSSASRVRALARRFISSSSLRIFLCHAPALSKPRKPLVSRSTRMRAPNTRSEFTSHPWTTAADTFLSISSALSFSIASLRVSSALRRWLSTSSFPILRSTSPLAAAAPEAMSSRIL